MRFVEATNDQQLARSPDRDVRFGSWIKIQLEDAVAKRFWLDELWRAVVKQYEMIPDLRDRDNTRDQGRYVIEIPLGATQADNILSSVTDLVFNTAPVFTVRGSPGYENAAVAFQLLADKLLLDDFVNLRGAADDVLADTIQMGTGAYYPVHAREVIKRATFRELNSGPRVWSIPPEDLVVPGGSLQNVDSLKIIGFRMYYNEAELREAAEVDGWDISNFKRCGNIEWVRQRRVEATRQDVDQNTVGQLYEVFSLHCYYDYDEDGFAEDLHVIWDRTSFALGKVSYSPYDSRPFVISRYQHRPHIFYGMGVLEMARPFQLEVTEWHNFKMQNAHIANARFWAYRLGAMGIGEELKISPNRAIGLADPANDLIEKKMGDVYPSAAQFEAQTIALSEQRVGTQSLGAPGMQAGKRTPAATAMSILQQQNKRFASPFENMRRAYADAANQCFMRMREQYLLGGDWRKNTLTYIIRAIGVKNAELVERVFKEATASDMRDKVMIEVTASSQTINRQADKQNAIEKMQVLGGYYDKVMQAGQILAAPAAPELKQMVVECLKGMNEAMRSFLRTYDNVRDPEIYIPKLPGVEQKDESGIGNTAEGPAGAEAEAPGATATAPVGASEPAGSSGDTGPSKPE